MHFELVKIFLRKEDPHFCIYHCHHCRNTLQTTVLTPNVCFRQTFIYHQWISIDSTFSQWEQCQRMFGVHLHDWRHFASLRLMTPSIPGQKIIMLFFAVRITLYCDNTNILSDVDQPHKISRITFKTSLVCLWVCECVCGCGEK